MLVVQITNFHVLLNFYKAFSDYNKVSSAALYMESFSQLSKPFVWRQVNLLISWSPRLIVYLCKSCSTENLFNYSNIKYHICFLYLTRKDIYDQTEQLCSVVNICQRADPRLLSWKEYSTSLGDKFSIS